MSHRGPLGSRDEGRRDLFGTSCLMENELFLSLTKITVSLYSVFLIKCFTSNEKKVFFFSSPDISKMKLTMRSQIGLVWVILVIGLSTVTSFAHQVSVY